MSKENLQLIADRIAIGLSAACALHCAVVPLMLAVLPILASTPLGDEGFHRAMLWIILPSSGIALTLGCRRHKDLAVLICGAAGLVILTFAAVAGHELVGETGERLLTLGGAAVLSLAHLRNYVLCRKAGCDHSA